MDHVSHAEPGQQNKTLYTASLALGRLVAGGSLDEATARAGLHHAMSRLPNTRPNEPWTTADIGRTITSGFHAATRNPRRLTDRKDQAA